MGRLADRVHCFPMALYGIAVLFCTVAHAQTLVHFDLPAQPLARSLKAIGSATNTNIGFNADQVAGLIAPSLKADLTVDAALKRVLAGTGLRPQHLDEHTIAIAPTKSSSSENQRIGPFPATTLATTEADDRTVAPQDPPQANSTDTPSSTARQANIDEIVVTGTHIRGVQPVGSELIVVDRTKIDQSGYSSIQDVIRAIPQNFAGSQSESTQVNEDSNAINSAYGSSANLRGFGADATLTLVNGHRLAPAGEGTFVDISAVPLNLVDRVEIIPDGASAVYGSDAVGGVVNIILKKDYSGADSHLRVSDLSGNAGRELNAGQTFGLDWQTGNVLFGYEYDRRAAVPASARSYTANSDLTSLGGENFDTVYSNPGNITSVGNTPTALAIPKGQNGTALSAAQLINGQTNLQNVNFGTDILPEQTRNSFVLMASQKLSERVNVFAQALYSDRRAVAYGSQARYCCAITVPESNAYRVLNDLFPGQGDIQENYNVQPDLGSQRNQGTSRALLAVVGASIDLGDSWNAEITATDGDTREDFALTNRIDYAGLSAAVASSELATALNPFADGSNSSRAAIASFRGSEVQSTRTEVRVVTVKADGSAYALPAGDLKVAVGGEFRSEQFHFSDFEYDAQGAATDVSSGLNNGNRRVRAAFGEAYVPLAKDLDVSLSGRYEDYSDAGFSLNPKVGVHWSATNWLSLRGTYGTSFKAPFLKDEHTPSSAFIAPIPAFLDPGATGPITNTLIVAGGNAELKPERARSWTTGFDLKLLMLENTKIGVTYFDTQFRDRITFPAPNALFIFAQPGLYPGALIRNPTQTQVNAAIASVAHLASPAPAPGTINAIVFDPLENVASVHANGVDLSMSSTMHTNYGDLGSTLEVAYLARYDQRATSTSPVIHNLDTLSNPVKNRARFGVSWNHRGLAMAGFLNYVGSYQVSDLPGSAGIGSWTTADLQVGVNSARAGGVISALGDTNLSFSVINVFNRDPPFVNGATGYGYDDTNANPYGRMIAVDVRHRW